MDGFSRLITKANEWVGKVGSFFFIPLTLIVTFEVVSRKFFNHPTIWAWDINIQISAILVALGGGFLLIENGHVIVDVFVMKWPKRARAIVDIITSTLFFFGVGVLVWIGAQYAQKAIVTNEHQSSLFEPPLAPLRVILVIGFVLLFLQGLVKLIRDIKAAAASRKEATR